MSATNADHLRTVGQLCMEVGALSRLVWGDVVEVDKHNAQAAKRAGDGEWLSSKSYDTVKTAALKRRSMDLTRALAVLRRSA